MKRIVNCHPERVEWVLVLFAMVRQAHHDIFLTLIKNISVYPCSSVVIFLLLFHSSNPLLAKDMHTLALVARDKDFVSSLEKSFENKDYIKLLKEKAVLEKVQAVFLSKAEPNGDAIRNLESELDYILYNGKDLKIQLYEADTGNKLKEWESGKVKPLEVEDFLEVQVCIRTLRELLANQKLPDFYLDDVSNNSEDRRLKRGDTIQLLFRIIDKKNREKLHITILGISNKTDIIQVFPPLGYKYTTEFMTSESIRFPSKEKIKLTVSPPFGEELFLIIASETTIYLPQEGTERIKSANNQFIKLSIGKKYKVVRELVNQLKKGTNPYYAAETIVTTKEKE